MFDPTHRYIGIGAINGIAMGAKVVIVQHADNDGVHTTVRCADDSEWVVLDEFVVELEAVHA